VKKEVRKRERTENWITKERKKKRERKKKGKKEREKEREKKRVWAGVGSDEREMIYNDCL
jgi:hypothetical protein